MRKFTDMGFDRNTVIATLKRLNYRGNNITNINENTVSLSPEAGGGPRRAQSRAAACQAGRPSGMLPCPRALAAVPDIRSLRRSSSSIASGSPGGVAYDGDGAVS